MFKKMLNQGEAGDNVGLLLRGTKREDVLRGQVACKPGSITPHAKFEGEIYALSKDEGGRHTPFFSNYRSGLDSSSRDLLCGARAGKGESQPQGNSESRVEEGLRDERQNLPLLSQAF